ncbi:MAG: hypothetical protein K8R36_00115 [Planctomycetales bacterium]|nr:hypothetical protein [Planctomycetales bacterium]
MTPLAYAAHYLKRFAPWLLDLAQHWGHARATRQRLESIEERSDAEVQRSVKSAA